MRVKTSALFAAALVVAALPATAGLDLGDLKIADPIAYAAPAGGNTRLRMAFANFGPSAVFILRLTTPVAREAEFRLNAGPEGIEPLTALTVPADDELRLDGATVWVELLGLNRALRPGEGFPATLHFVNGGKVTLRVAVEPRPKPLRNTGVGG